jgi:hypothetical protein
MVVLGGLETAIPTKQTQPRIDYTAGAGTNLCICLELTLADEKFLSTITNIPASHIRGFIKDAYISEPSGARFPGRNFSTPIS